MHRITNDTRITCRLPDVVVRRLAEQAAARAMNLSEYMRSIAREKVGLN